MIPSIITSTDGPFVGLCKGAHHVDGDPWVQWGTGENGVMGNKKKTTKKKGWLGGKETEANGFGIGSDQETKRCHAHAGFRMKPRADFSPKFLYYHPQVSGDSLLLPVALPVVSFVGSPAPVVSHAVWGCPVPAPSAARGHPGCSGVSGGVCQEQRSHPRGQGEPGECLRTRRRRRMNGPVGC